jgi:hypothetical protein
MDCKIVYAMISDIQNILKHHTIQKDRQIFS